MEIHWLADLCVVGALLLLYKLIASLVRRVSPAPHPDMRRSRLLAALDGSGTGTWLWELSTRQFLCDNRACTHLGVRSGSILSWEDFLGCIDESERPRVDYQMQCAVDSGSPFELSVRVLTEDGSERFIQLSGRLETDDLGAPVRLSGALRDVTQERRRNAEVRRQAQILAQVHDAIFATTLDGRILSWNAAAHRMFGYEADQATGRKIQMLWFPEDEDVLEHQISDASLASGAHEFVSRVRHKSGAQLYAHFRLAMLRDAEGTAVGLLACSHDVTRQQEEHELLTLQASALQSIADAVIVTDLREVIVHSNAAAATLFQRQGQSLAGMPVAALIAGTAETRELRMAELRVALAHERRWTGELVCTRATSPEPIIASTSITVLDLSSGPCWVWVQQDITEQRRAEAALRERERRFRKLADSAPMMVWMTDVNGASEYVNQAWLAHCGMTREEARGSGWQDAIHSEDRTELQRLIRCKPGSREPFEIELRVNTGNGRIAHTLTRGAPRYEAGRLLGFIGSAVDITNIKRAEQERIAFEQQALKSQKLHSLGVLAGGIAHDFNNLLVSVLGFSDLALRELAPRHPAYELVKQIEVGSRRAADLVEQVLTFAGKARRADEELDVNQSVREMLSLLERTVGSKVVFNLELGRGLPAITGDAAQVGQVVMNLVLNSADALGESGGLIRIRTGLHSLTQEEIQHWICAENLRPGRYIQLEVHDGGCGMDDETLSQVFDPFFTTKFTGRGLGLSAVMGVVRSHAGAIRVDSAPGKGSSFRVLFPASVFPAEIREEPSTPAGCDTCVLVIDDDPTVMQATRQMLQSGGIKVYCAQDETEAVAVFQQHASQIQLVLLDVVMPNTTPAWVSACLREVRGDVRILLTSGFSESSLRPALDGSTFVGFIPKPYDRSRLLEAVCAARATPGQGARRGIASA